MSRGSSPGKALMTMSSTPAREASPAKLKTPAWREVHERVLAERGLSNGDEVSLNHSAQQVSYSVGTRPGGDGQARAVLNAQRTDGHQDVFDMLDRNHDGVISRSEFRQFQQVEPVTSRSSLRGKSPDAGQERALQASTVREGVGSGESSARPSSSLAGLAAERDRLQRQVQEMRGAVADTRRELNTQHEQQKLQSAELRATLTDLQATSRQPAENRRQALPPRDSWGARGAGIGGTTSDAGSTLSKRESQLQVDNLAQALASQDQKFARLESEVTAACNSQRGQLDQALQQNRQLARNLEEEGARRTQSLADIQSLIMQGQVSESRQVQQLQTELAKATNAMQGQSGDWMDLARVIKSEVTNLAGAMRAERDARALEAGTQRVEMSRMIDSARRANIVDSVETYASGTDLPPDTMTRAGAVAVRKMTDLTQALVHNLEESMILRAGLIAGTFHTWRCEATLWKVGRRYRDEFSRTQDAWEAHLAGEKQNFEDSLRSHAEQMMSHKDIVRQRQQLLVDKWCYGEKAGLTHESYKAWHTFVAKEKSLRRNAASIHKACFQWVEGKSKGLVHSTYLAWHSRAALEAAGRKHGQGQEELERRYQETLEKEREKANAKIQEGMDKIAAHHKQAKGNLEIAMGKWAKGGDKGALIAVMGNWKQWIAQEKIKSKQSEAAQQAVRRFLEGDARGIKHGCFKNWKNEVLHTKKMHAEKAQWDQLLDGERAAKEKELQEERDREKQKLDKAHESVTLMVRKFLMGDANGLKKDVFEVWYRYCEARAKAGRRTEAVHMQLMKFMEGSARGDLHCCFLHWKECAMRSAAERKAQANLEEERKQLRSYMSDMEGKHKSQLDEQQAELARRKDEAQKVIQYTMARWEMGDTKGLLGSVVKDWRQYVAKAKQDARNRAAVHDALLRSIVGDAKAGLQMSFMNWRTMTLTQKQERHTEDQIAKEKAHWEESAKQWEMKTNAALAGAEDAQAQLRAKAHATNELMLKQWMGGNAAGMLSTVFADWRRIKEMMASKRRGHKAVMDSIERALMGEKRGTMHSCFTNWSNMAKLQKEGKARIDQLEAQVEKLIEKQQAHLRQVAMTMGAAQGPVLLAMVLKAWIEVSQGVKHLEKEREREVELEEMKRHGEMQRARKKELEAKALISLGMKDNKLVLTEVFTAWCFETEKSLLEHNHKMNANAALHKFADVWILNKMKKDTEGLLACCFTEWHRIGHALLHARVLEACDNEARNHEETRIYAQQLEQRNAQLEEQLLISHQQIMHITETLQKELQTKEELTVELRDAYNKMRSSCFTTTTTPTADGSRALGSGPLAFSRPSSAQSRSYSTGSGVARPPRKSLESVNSITSGYGQETSMRPGDGGESADAVFDMIDRNNDGVITRAEYDRFQIDVLRDPQRLAGEVTGTSGSRGVSTSIGGSRGSSPSRGCDWDSVFGRMKDEGLVRTRDLGQRGPPP